MRFWTRGVSRVLLAALAYSTAWAQSPKATAPIDLTGYWVSLITEDWRTRMLTARPVPGRAVRWRWSSRSSDG